MQLGEIVNEKNTHQLLYWCLLAHPQLVISDFIIFKRALMQINFSQFKIRNTASSVRGSKNLAESGLMPSLMRYWYSQQRYPRRITIAFILNVLFYQRLVAFVYRTPVLICRHRFKWPRFCIFTESTEEKYWNNFNSFTYEPSMNKWKNMLFYTHFVITIQFKQWDEKNLRLDVPINS